MLSVVVVVWSCMCRYCMPDPDRDPYHGFSGRDIIVENLRQKCIWNHYGGDKAVDQRTQEGVGLKWWHYVREFNNECSVTGLFTDQACISKVMKTVGIEERVIRQCMDDSGGVDNDVDNQILDMELQEKVGREVHPHPLMDRPTSQPQAGGRQAGQTRERLSPVVVHGGGVAGEEVDRDRAVGVREQRGAAGRAERGQRAVVDLCGVPGGHAARGVRLCGRHAGPGGGVRAVRQLPPSAQRREGTDGRTTRQAGRTREGAAGGAGGGADRLAG